MLINQAHLLEETPIKNMLQTKERAFGVSHGLTEAGYDIRLKQDVTFLTSLEGRRIIYRDEDTMRGRFVLASAMEEFQMPPDLVGVVHDKSTWARKGLSVFNTVIEPGFHGGLTLELVYHGEGELHIPAGSGIAQVLFSRIAVPAEYRGKYQNQGTDPVPAIIED